MRKSIMLMAIMLVSLMAIPNVAAVGGVEHVTYSDGTVTQLVEADILMTDSIDGAPFTVLTAAGYTYNSYQDVTRKAMGQAIAYNIDYFHPEEADRFLEFELWTEIYLINDEAVLDQEYILNEAFIEPGDDKTPAEGYSMWWESHADGSKSTIMKYTVPSLPYDGEDNDGSWFQVEVRLDEYPYEVDGTSYQQPSVNVFFTYYLTNNKISRLELFHSIIRTGHTVPIRDDNINFDYHSYYEYYDSDTNYFWQLAPSTYVWENSMPSLFEEESYAKNITHTDLFDGSDTYLNKPFEMPLYMMTCTGENGTNPYPSPSIPSQYSPDKERILETMVEWIDGTVDTDSGQTTYQQGETITVVVEGLETEPNIYDVKIEFLDDNFDVVWGPDGDMDYNFLDLQDTTPREELLDGVFTLEHTFTIPTGIYNGTYYVRSTVTDLQGNWDIDLKFIYVGESQSNKPIIAAFGETALIELGVPITYEIGIYDDSTWVRYKIDWDDGEITDWVQLNESERSGSTFYDFPEHTYELGDVYAVKIYTIDSDGKEGSVFIDYLDTSIGEESILLEMIENPLNIIAGLIIFVGILYAIKSAIGTWRKLTPVREAAEAKSEAIVEVEGITRSLDDIWENTKGVIKTTFEFKNLGWFIYGILGLFLFGIVYWLIIDSISMDFYTALGTYVNSLVLYIKVFAYFLSSLLWYKVDYNAVIYMIALGSGLYGVGSLFSGSRVRRI